MLQNLNSIVLYCLITFGVAVALYPLYIRFLATIKAGKTIREDDVSGQKAVIFNELHKHKAGTPTMGGGLFLIIMIIMIAGSYVAQYLGFSRFSLVSQRETFILLGGFFGMGLLGLVDDIFNIKGIGKVKGLSARVKLVVMVVIAGAISVFFAVRLGVEGVHLWPIIVGSESDFVMLGLWMIPLTFFFTISLVNAINITDGLDGLAGGLLLMILAVLSGVTFLYDRYLATTVIGIVMATLVAFLRYNIYPAKVFMGDSGAFAVGGLVATLVYLLNIKMHIFVPFMILFAIFWLELLSSFLQIVSKKFWKRKIFPIAPFHHLLQYRGRHESTIVMRLWVIQGVLCIISMVLILYGIR